MKKQTKTQESAAVVPPSQAKQVSPENQMDWSGEDMPTGFENTRPEDFGIPFLSLMQKGSPEVDEDHPDHETRKIEGIEQGMIINTLSREIVYHKDESNPLLFLPVTHEKLYQEWKPRNQGGGFVQSHNSPVILTQCTRNEKNKDILPNGNEIITTSYFAGFLLGHGEPIRTIIALSSTQLKKARAWLNMMQSIKINGRIPPMYSHIYNITTVKEQNDEGTWWGWKIEINRVLTKADMPLIEMAKDVSSQAIQKRLIAPPSNAPTSEDEAIDRAAGK